MDTYTSTATQSAGGAGGGGTVTSVTGTANQIDSTGGNTPVLSADPNLDAQRYALDTGAGGANVYTINPPIALTAYTVGQVIRFKVANASTGASTINVSGLGAKSLQKNTTGSLAALGASGDLVTSGIYTAVYDGTVFVLQSQSSTPYIGGALAANSILLGNSNNQITTTGANTTMTGAGLLTKYQGLTLAGQGFGFILGATIQKNETTTADANVLTVTPAAAASTFRITVAISVSAATSGVIAWTLSWTDSNGNAQSNIAMPLFQFGTAAPNTTFTTSAAGNYSGEAIIDINSAAANIVVKWVGGGTTTAKITAIAERIG